MNSKVIAEALLVLKQGGTILYPTDTIWGIGGDATNEDVIKKIYAIKQRPDAKSLVSLVNDKSMLEKLTEISEAAHNELSSASKATTIIYENVKGIHQSALADDGSAAIRIPNNEFCKALITQFGKPLISTSANLSGAPSPTSYDSISEDIKSKVDYCVPKEIETSQNARASRILKLKDNQVIIIRE